MPLVITFRLLVGRRSLPRSGVLLPPHCGHSCEIETLAKSGLPRMGLKPKTRPSRGANRTAGKRLHCTREREGWAKKPTPLFRSLKRVVTSRGSPAEPPTQPTSKPACSHRQSEARHNRSNRAEQLFASSTPAGQPTPLDETARSARAAPSPLPLPHRGPIGGEGCVGLARQSRVLPGAG
jgi:hypothetical protein